ncbi:glycosyltransferase family 4 protein [Salmonirosea aquatica]|uniref:Glycosyltransferase n=1 Tax=Salmonirosea aquatica TaxID=2654236 RepID=A0A7C9F331_9BACT|nr:glycosyltransferase [Cytophagaceae bacterium SJW1-29]
MRKLQALVNHIFLLPKLAFTWFGIKAISDQTGLFCFFPYYQTGGSERVHADILQSVSEAIPREHLIVFFTKPSDSNTFKSFFYRVARCFEIAGLDRSKYRQIFIRLISRVINNCPNPTVLGANATYLYEIIPYLKASVRVIDLTHSFVPESNNPIELASLPYVHRLAKRVVINQAVKRDYERLYTKHGLAQKEWLERIEVIHNQLSCPPWDLAKKNYDIPPLRVLFVGRNSPEKRILLLGQIAHELRHEPVEFTLVGPQLAQRVDPEHRDYFSFQGEITDPEVLINLYKKHHVVLITSRREGFPLVLAEGMAHGALPMATNVGALLNM